MTDYNDRMAEEIKALAAQCLALRERVAFLESREVCTVAHDNVETCGYCQRDEAEARLAEAERLMAEWFGDPCEEYEQDCVGCQAWKFLGHKWPADSAGEKP